MEGGKEGRVNVTTIKRADAPSSWRGRCLKVQDERLRPVEGTTGRCRKHAERDGKGAQGMLE